MSAQNEIYQIRVKKLLGEKVVNILFHIWCHLSDFDMHWMCQNGFETLSIFYES